MYFKKISADDRLPLREGKYIVFRKSKIGTKREDRLETTFKKGKWSCSGDITHWLEEYVPKNRNSFRDKFPEGRTEFEKLLDRLKESTKCKCQECN